MAPLIVDCQAVSIDDVVRVARAGEQVTLGVNAWAAMTRSRETIKTIVDRGEVVYGISTGFGRLADRVIPREDLERLQRNLILSHSVGVGAPLHPDAVRAMMLLRVVALARGYSGIRPETVQQLIDMLNHDIVPVVPEKGSVGASGDLAPLAHLALGLIGEGEVLYRGEVHLAADALGDAGLQPAQLTAKEGLALINGTQFMTAIGALLLHDAKHVLDTADVSGAMSLEAVRGTNRAFDERVQEVRPHPGQKLVAQRLRTLTQGSELIASHRHNSHKVQDPYSFRCMPQVHGASRDAIAYAQNVIEIEMNSATDNPLVFADTGDVISGGNFHGQPVALALDFVAIALAEIANIAERRIEAMLDPGFSELPAFLTPTGGVDSGLMVSQYTAAALVSENKILAHPASVDSIPTSANQEDHVSMGATAAIKARTILRNVQSVLAIELLCAAEGIEHRRPLKTSDILESVHALIRANVFQLDGDRALYRDVAVLTELIANGTVASTAGLHEGHA